MNNKYHFVYILKSLKDGGFYIGETSNLKKRLINHNAGKTISTKNRRPLILIYFEGFISTKDAKARERYLKSGYGRKQIKDMLKNTLM